MTILRKLLFVTLVVITYFITLNNYYDVEYVSSNDVYLLEETEDTYYKIIDDNTMYTTINGISNMYLNFINDGYSIYKEDVNNDYIDLILVKNERPTYRLYMTYPECKLTIFSSNYEESYKGLSYIIERSKD